MAQYIETETDVNVEGVEFFVKDTPDGYIYEDAACEIKANCETLKHAFNMNDIVIIDNGVACRPCNLSIEEGVATVSYFGFTEVENTLTAVPKQVVSYDEPAEENNDGE